jgi:hypothetical protein
LWKLCCLWDNVEKCGRARQATDYNIIQCMHFACWITKATDTLKMCNNYCFSTATAVLWTCLNVMFICTLPVLYFSVFHWMYCCEHYVVHANGKFYVVKYWYHLIL